MEIREAALAAALRLEPARFGVPKGSKSSELFFGGDCFFPVTFVLEVGAFFVSVDASLVLRKLDVDFFLNSFFLLLSSLLGVPPLLLLLPLLPLPPLRSELRCCRAWASVFRAPSPQKYFRWIGNLSIYSDKGIPQHS